MAESKSRIVSIGSDNRILIEILERIGLDDHGGIEILLKA